MANERPNHTTNITQFTTGKAGAQLAEFHLRKAFQPEKTDQEIWDVVYAQDWPDGLYQISSNFQEPYIKFLG
jgi:hypothetical protein